MHGPDNNVSRSNVEVVPCLQGEIWLPACFAVEVEAPIDLDALEESNTVDAERENEGKKGIPLSSLEISLHG